MLDHLNIIRPIVEMLGGLFLLYFIWIFLVFFVTERQKNKYRR